MSCESEASLVYTGSTRTARAMRKDPLPTNATTTPKTFQDNGCTEREEFKKTKPMSPEGYFKVSIVTLDYTYSSVHTLYYTIIL